MTLHNWVPRPDKVNVSQCSKCGALSNSLTFRPMYADCEDTEQAKSIFLVGDGTLMIRNSGSINHPRESWAFICPCGSLTELNREQLVELSNVIKSELANTPKE